MLTLIPLLKESGFSTIRCFTSPFPIRCSLEGSYSMQLTLEEEDLQALPSWGQSIYINYLIHSSWEIHNKLLTFTSLLVRKSFQVLILQYHLPFLNTNKTWLEKRKTGLSSKRKHVLSLRNGAECCAVIFRWHLFQSLFLSQQNYIWFGPMFWEKVTQLSVTSH